MFIIRMCTCGKFLGIKFCWRWWPAVSHGLCDACVKRLYPGVHLKRAEGRVKNGKL